MSNANFCNFFDNIPQILRVKASNKVALAQVDGGAVPTYCRRRGTYLL